MEQVIRWTAIGLISIGITLTILFSQHEQTDSASFVHITGTITQLTQKNNVAIVIIQPSPPVPVIIFGNPALMQGNRVSITAKAQDYKGRLELVAQEVSNE